MPLVVAEEGIVSVLMPSDVADRLHEQAGSHTVAVAADMSMWTGVCHSFPLAVHFQCKNSRHLLEEHDWRLTDTYWAQVSVAVDCNRQWYVYCMCS